MIDILEQTRRIIITPSLYTEAEINNHMRMLKDGIILTQDEAKLLLNYLTNGVGYINPEFWNGINQLHRKLEENINGKKEFKPCKKETELTEK